MSAHAGMLFIGGEWTRPCSPVAMDCVDPATGQKICMLADVSVEDVDQAVRAARAAFDTGVWPELGGSKRAGFLREISARITQRRDMLAALEVRDNGKPMPEALWDIDDAAACFAFYADIAEQDEQSGSQTVTLPDTRFSCRVVQEPLGVVAAITPWNYPLLMVAWKVAPALAAGCTIIVKPSELTSLTSLELASIIQEVGIPPGVFNLVTGGGKTGAALSSHAHVDKVAFTGSVPTGRMVMTAAARDIKAVSLELGGKSPFIVFADSDVAKAVEWILFGIFWNQGQVCSATSRVLVEASLYPKVLERLVAEVARISIGSGLEKGILMGPLVSEAQRQKVIDAVALAVQHGARIACGGKIPPERQDGFFFEPTVLVECTADNPAWIEEIFGPVVCLMPFETEAEALHLANDSRFGLAAAVMSGDRKRCDRVASKLRAGIVWINCSQPTFVEAPWGGYKLSGIGRELGIWGYKNYQETKQITAYESDEDWGWYIQDSAGTGG